MAAEEELRRMGRSAEQSKEELLQVKEKLDSVSALYEQAQQKSGHQEVEISLCTKILVCS